MDFWTFIFGIAVGLVSIMIFNRFFKNDSIAEDLKEQFKNLSNEILVQQADAIVEKATNTVKTTNEMIINPLEVQLEKMKVSLEDIERDRQVDKGALTAKIDDLNLLNRELNESTKNLNSALKGNTTTGTWGNQKLKNIIEMSGMTEHVDFNMEVDADILDKNKKRRRADAVIKLADGGKIPIDAKTSLTAFLKIEDEKDPEERERLIKEHSNNVRNHIKDLYKIRKYHTLFNNSVPFTIMFVPHEPALNTAFNKEEGLFDEAFKNNIIVTSASSLYSLLQVIAQGWSQVTVDENQQKIMGLAEGLYDSMVTFTEKYSKFGKSITGLVDSYNNSIGSFDKTFINSRKKLIDYGVDFAKVKSLEDKDEVKELETPEVRELKNFKE